MIHFEADEKIIKTVRKHWLVFVLEMLSLFFVALLPLLVYLLVPISVIDFFSRNLDGSATILFIFFWLLWVLILWMIAFYIWTDYYLDVWIITNRRIIDIEQKGFFNREISSFRMDRIQDVTTEISGIVATFMNYGDVHVQTASTDRSFIIPDAKGPNEVKHLILKLHHESMEGRLDRTI
jgi:uncharacterized membrane protein YdbT with pleckstrin-like domain